MRYEVRGVKDGRRVKAYVEAASEAEARERAAAEIVIDDDTRVPAPAAPPTSLDYLAAAATSVSVRRRRPVRTGRLTACPTCHLPVARLATACPRCGQPLDGGSRTQHLLSAGCAIGGIILAGVGIPAAQAGSLVGERMVVAGTLFLVGGLIWFAVVRLVTGR